MTPIFIFAADLHLDIARSARHPAMTGDSRYGLEQVVSYCVNAHLPLLLGGDIFDKARPDPDTVRFFLDQMARLRHAGVMAYFVQGDHDRDPLHPWPALSDVAYHMHHKLIEFPGGFTVWGQDFVPRAQAAEAFAQIPETAKALLVHISFSDIRRIGATHADLAMIPHVQYVLTGDYHVCGAYSATGASGQPLTALSPGSTSSRALNEPADKYVLRCSVSGDGLLHWERLPLRSRPQVNLSVMTPEQLDTAVTSASTYYAQTQASATAHLDGLPPLPEALRKPIVWVKYRDDIPDAYARLAAAFAEDWFFFPDPQRVEQTTQVDMSAVPVSAWDSLRDAFAGLRPQKDEIYADACRLLDGYARGRLKEELQAVVDGCMARHMPKNRETEDVHRSTDAA